MKKFLCLFLVITVLLSFAACGKKYAPKDTSSDTDNRDSSVTDTNGSNNNAGLDNSSDGIDISGGDDKNNSDNTLNNDNSTNGGNGDSTGSNGDSTDGNGDSTGGNGDSTGGNGDSTGGNGGSTGGNGDSTGGNGDSAGGNGDSTGGNGDSTGGNGDSTGSNGDSTGGNGGASSNEKVDLSKCLVTLLNNYKWNPMSKIPATLRPEYQDNLIDPNDIPTDYSSFVSISDIPQKGIGEQWNMVVENMQQSEIFFNVLTVVDTLTAVSVSGFNNYLDKNPADTAMYQFKYGIYSVTISCTQENIDYVLDFTTTLPALGEQSVQIALSMDIETQVTNARVQIGDMNVMRYTINGNEYDFAIKYLGVRRAYFEMTESNDGSITGHIYEYLTVSQVEVASVADFYINDKYLTVTGNKADDMIVFDGAICELYSISNGQMIGYEVKEALEVLGVGVTYNTLWFNLDDVNGITSVKYIPKSSTNEEASIYINRSANKWTPVKYGLSGGLKSNSRRFDIEFRTQYFYYYDADNEKYEKIKAEIPMLFVQEEVFSSLTADVMSANNVNISIVTNSADLNTLKSEYYAKIDLIKENKGKYSVDMIIAYIGDKKTF